jgi:hypothetical protein
MGQAIGPALVSRDRKAPRRSAPFLNSTPCAGLEFNGDLPFATVRASVTMQFGANRSQMPQGCLVCKVPHDCCA